MNSWPKSTIACPDYIRWLSNELGLLQLCVTNITLCLHLGTSRTSFRSRISAHGGQCGRGCQIHLSVHSHMLRHACGFKLANDGHDTRAIQAYLGHRSIMSTVRYTALTPNRFKNFWKD